MEESMMEIRQMIKLQMVVITMIAISTAVFSQNQTVAHWSFDSVAGNTYFDLTGNGYDASATGTGVGVGVGVKGNALSCTGSAYEIVVANSRDSMNCRRFSIESWFYLNISPSQISVCYNSGKQKWVQHSYRSSGKSGFQHVERHGQRMDASQFRNDHSFPEMVSCRVHV
jgi:hypothetical protein